MIANRKGSLCDFPFAVLVYLNLYVNYSSGFWKHSLQKISLPGTGLNGT